MSQQPKKPGAQKSKRHKLSISTADKWKQILKEVEKLEAPISVIQTITVSLVDGTQVDIDVQELIAEGMDINDLEREINQKLYDLDELIDNVDFFINIDHIANTVQSITDTLLKNL